jgi:thiaminase/transcriptional activator TenA
MPISDELSQQNQDLSNACLQHPFVQGMADDTLSQSRFAYYVAPDVFFLGGFTRTYSITVTKAPD